jgi:hypothetical protein
MRIGRLVVVGLLLAGPVWAQQKKAEKAPSPTPTPAALQRSTSASRQFIIYHSDGTVRGRIARKVEDIKSQWLKSLQMTDEWKLPIVLQVVPLAPVGTPRIRTAFYLGDGDEAKVQIDVFDLSVLKSGEFDTEVYRALCLEVMYRQNLPKAGKAYQQPPVWLLEGLVEDALAKNGEGIGPGLYDRIIESGSPAKLEIFLKERPEMMDATTRAIYRARSMALLRALLASPGGPQGMVAWLRSIPSSNPTDAGKMLDNFPNLASRPADLSKQWALALADASATNRTKSLPMAETTRQLALIMDFGAPVDPKKPNEAMISGAMALPVIARTKAGPFIVAKKAEELLRLQMRAHPLFRPIVEEYQLIATELVHKPKKNLEKRIEKNIELQKALVSRASEIEDYMNWFEAAKLETPSREFDVLLEMPTEGGRGDPITRYMNDLEARGW